MAQAEAPPVYDTVTSSDTYTSLGIALIIVNQKFRVPGYKERRGAHEDCRLLREAFETMGFTVIEVFNKTAIEILREVQKVSKMDHSAYTNFVLAASSHGQRQADDPTLRMCDTIVGVDGNVLKFYTLTSYFMESQCPSLKGKPKLFFIQACRGEELSEVATASECTTHMVPPQGDPPPGGYDEVDPTAGARPPRPGIVYSDDIPLMRDYLLACAVPPDFFAFHNAKGSWFIRVLCEVLLEQREHSDLLSMLTEVNSRVSEFTTNTPNNPEYHGRHTMPWVSSMLRKQVHL